MEEDAKSKVLFLSVVLCLVTALVYIGSANGGVKSASKKPAAQQTLKAADLGMTLDEFKAAYNQKAVENELAELSLDNVTVEEKPDKSGVLCYFGDVVMMVDVSPSSGLVSKISVGAKPFTKTSKAEKTKILLLQSTVWGLSSMVFNPVMENQQYRESALKRILSGRNTDYMISGSIKIAAVQIEDLLTINIEPRD